jgi:hypothetical protein
MKDFKLTSPGLLSPKVKLPSFTEILSSLKHHRCLSAKQSPYENTSNIEKLKTKLNPFSCKSPKIKPAEKTEGKLRNKKKSLTKDKIKIKKGKKSQKGTKLVQITDRRSMVVAPKIFENQFFMDVYDLQGNHDRIMEISQSHLETSQDDSILVKGKLEILNNIQYTSNKMIDERRIRPPENSYLEETKAPNDIHSDLMKKLSELVIIHREDDDP